jgi:nitrite reductase/ring-hydroxylating ferredoxin subunit
MERKEFIRSCGYACLGGTLLGSILAACKSASMISGSIVSSDLIVPVASFLKKDKTWRQYVVVHNEQLDYPVCVYRLSADQYTALFMRCPHQGAELQVFGDKLQCPAHGSEFSNKGVVENGPADTNLRTFPVTIQNEQIKISLK